MTRIRLQLLALPAAIFHLAGCASNKFTEPQDLDFDILDSSEVIRGKDGLLKNSDGRTIDKAKIFCWYAQNTPESVSTVIDGIMRSITSYKVDGTVASKLTGGTGIVPRYHYPGGELWAKTHFKRGRIIVVDYFEKGKLVTRDSILWGETTKNPTREALKKGEKMILDFFDPDAAVIPYKEMDRDSSWGEIGQAYLGLGEMTLEIPGAILKSIFGKPPSKGHWRDDR